MLSDKLKSFEYYQQKMPLYMRNSYGILEHFEILWNLLYHLDITEDNILKAFDILNPDYINTVVYTYDDSSEQDKFDFLDRLAEIYGMHRDFDVSYTYNNEEVKKSLHLTNSELLKLIKARIIQNNFDGTYKQLREYYDSMGFPIAILQGNLPATAFVYISPVDLEGNPIYITENEKDMILANLFTIKSMGITYQTQIVDIKALAIWDSKDPNRAFDKGIMS